MLTNSVKKIKNRIKVILKNYSKYALLKRRFLSFRLKMSILCFFLISRGSPFHNRGAAEAKARSPRLGSVLAARGLSI